MDDELQQLRQKRMDEIMKVVGAAASSGGPKGKPVVLDESNLEDFVAKNQIAMIDVWAAWCGPCRMMEPIVEELAHELSGRAGVGKMDADAHPDIVAQFGVQGIPAFLFFKNGMYVTRLVGARPKRDFLDVIQQVEALQVPAEPDAGPDVA